MKRRALLIMRQLSIFFLASVFISSTTFGQILTPMNNGNGREYFVGTSLGEPLLTVNLVNGVTAPGVYHVPISTNMAELFSYAGGVNSNADLGNVMVRRTSSSGQPTLLTYDFTNVFESEKSELPRLQDRDIIHIEQETGLDQSLKWMSLASMLASVLAAVVIIEDRRD